MRSIWRTTPPLTRRAVVLVCLADAVVAVSYGAGAVRSGLAVWVPAVLALFVLAGSSELLFVTIVAAGGSAYAAAAAGLLVNSRHLPYGAATGPILPPSRLTRAWAAHLSNDESVAFGLSGPGLRQRRASFWLCGLGILIAWPLGATIGAIGLGRVPNLDRFGLDALFPAVLVAVALPLVRDRFAAASVLGGVALALGAWTFLPPGAPQLVSIAAVVPVLIVEHLVGRSGHA